jgi:hypothetical protein
MNKYIELVNNNEFKNKSLEDNVYFTLRDIFWNISVNEFELMCSANELAGELTNNIPY